MHYVIIGNSAAAIGCVDGLRSIDKSSSITIVSAEKYHTYSRPLISYWLNGKVDTDKMYYRKENYYQQNGCTTILGKKAVEIDADKKEIKLEDQQCLKYDKLLVATGSKPVIPPIEGLDSVKNLFTFFTWDSAQDLKKAVGKDSRVLILGAGLIGLKAAEGLRDLCKKVTVVDLANRILPSILDLDGAEYVEKHLEEQGISIVLNDAAVKFAQDTATLKTGKEIEFDILVVAVGVEPNTILLQNAGALVKRGIWVDPQQKTSLPDIFAAGDCVESYDISSHESKVLALLPNAYMQGQIAGMNMAGKDEKYTKAIPMNAISFFGLPMITAGSLQGKELVAKGQNYYKKLVYADGLLKGYILIGNIERAGIYTSLIREQIPLKKINFDLLSIKPQLLVFDERTRKEKLAGGDKK
ncbi:FAD-dependent oxidoreductase [Bacillota bacterium LX-D]|nr:FAD-dependent oxidoreductase [Bacillota bacterium LX-D]